MGVEINSIDDLIAHKIGRVKKHYTYDEVSTIVRRLLRLEYAGMGPVMVRQPDGTLVPYRDKRNFTS